MQEDKDIKQIIAKNLANLRKNKKITQTELAEQFGYSDKAISKWENGDTLPDIQTLYQLCEFYNVTLDFLVSEQSFDEKIKYINHLNKRVIINNSLIELLYCSFVWILAVIIYVYLYTFLCVIINKPILRGKLSMVKQSNKKSIFVMLTLILTIISFLVLVLTPTIFIRSTPVWGWTTIFGGKVSLSNTNLLEFNFNWTIYIIWLLILIVGISHWFILVKDFLDCWSRTCKPWKNGLRRWTLGQRYLSSYQCFVINRWIQSCKIKIRDCYDLFFLFLLIIRF